MSSTWNNTKTETALCPLKVDWLGEEWSEAEPSARARVVEDATRADTTSLETQAVAEQEVFRLTAGKTFELSRIYRGKAIQVRVDFHALLGSLVHFVAFFSLLVLMLFAISLWVAVATGTL